MVNTKIRTNHHYVSQFYLRNFASRINGKLSYINVYEKEKSIYETNIRNVSSENGLYTFQDKTSLQDIDCMEEVFGAIESIIAPIWNKIISGDLSLTPAERGELDYFLALSHSRTLSFRDTQKEIYSSGMDLVLQSAAQNKKRFKSIAHKATLPSIDNDETLEKTREFIINKGYDIGLSGGESGLFKDAIELTRDIYDYLRNKNYHLIQAKNDKVFVTSDNPIILIPYDRNNRKGFKYSSIIISITPKICLLLDNDKMPKEKFSVSNKQVDMLNSCIMFYARRNVYSSIKSKSIMNRYTNVRKLENKQKTLHLRDSSYLITIGDTPPYLSGEIFN